MAEMKFEQALSKLEKIVEEMESGELSLDDSLKKYEEGMKLSLFCTKKLKEAEKKIEILIQDKEGNLKAEPFDTEELKEEPTEEPPSKNKKKDLSLAKEDDEDLLF